MPKILVKGGIWKNTEDEILKVAVMKYGKNQWSRIASLLHRKTAKQCKARWYEWLDPSIKKTEWTKEEEEKLLHLAKLMPTQWRTIAPMVGRTANQCLERYEYLLDQAQIQESGLNEQDDPRKLRPGEVDPNPETKPARPDPIDMDEDELEMLSEARARLANTQGKKAKRKAREKQLDEARRLATLQKKRELRSAGCNLILLQKIKRCCDLNFEIPFEKKVPAGFFDTSTEKINPNSEEFKELRIKEYTRRDRSEILERRKDKEKYDKNKDQDLLNVLKKNAPTITIRRSKLVLPTPQISQSELEEVIKLGDEASSAKKLVENDSINFPTNSLLHDYSMTPITNSESLGMRTPLSSDILMKEAQTILALNKVETPLKGGMNVPISDEDMAMGEKGIAPKSTPVQTANTVLSSPFVTTPGTQGYGEKEYTPLRDSLSINKDSNYSSVNTTPYHSKHKAEFNERIRKRFSSLPQPKPIDINMLEIEKNETEISETSLEITADAGEEEARLEKLNRLEELKKEALIPESIKYKLPIPTHYPSDCEFFSILGYTDPNLVNAEKLIFKESNSFISQVISSKNSIYSHGFEPEQIESARSLILGEISDLSTDEAEFRSRFSQIWKKCHNLKNEIIQETKDDIYLTKSSKELKNNQEIMAKNQKSLKKMQDKIKIIYGGYSQRREKLIAQINDLVDKNTHADLELNSFKALQLQELISGTKRLSSAQYYFDMVKSTEEHLQKVYTELSRSSKPAKDE